MLDDTSSLFEEEELRYACFDPTQLLKPEDRTKDIISMSNY